MKKREIDLYMDFAQRCAQMSYATRLKVGAIIVKDTRIISQSWNGTPPGEDNTCEYRVSVKDGKGEYLNEDGTSYNLVTKPNVRHGEWNAIQKLKKHGETGDGATLFCTHSPCYTCALEIVENGIVAVYYNIMYRCDKGLDYLRDNSVSVYEYMY